MTEAKYETGDVVEIEHRGENMPAIVKSEQPDHLDSDYTVAVNEEGIANGYIYIGADKILGKRGHLTEYEPHGNPFQDVNEMLEAFQTVRVECEQCGDGFDVSKETLQYGTPDFCSEACGINAGNLKEGKRGR